MVKLSKKVYQKYTARLQLVISMCYNPERLSAGNRTFKYHKEIKRMNITKKQAGLGVAIIVILGVLGWVFMPQPAEAADVDFTFGAEKKIEADTNKMYLDSSVDLPLGIKGTSGVNYSVDNSLDATFDSFELDFSKGLNDKISVYSQSDFDVNLDHTDTTLGFKVKF